MKTTQTIGAITPFLCALLAGISPAEAGKDTLTVTSGGIEFDVIRYDDGRSKPYKIKFDNGGVSSTYTFFESGAVNTIKVDSEKYKAVYKSNGDLKRVKQTAGGRRNLAEDEEDVEEGNDAAIPGARRSLFACGDCVEAWDAVCDEGVPSVCDLTDYGSPFSDMAVTSLETLCYTFGAACSASGGEETCAEHCEGDDDGECVLSLYVTLDWYNDGAITGGADMDIHVIEPSGTEVSSANLCGDYGFHDVSQDAAVENAPEDYVLFSDLSGDAMLGDYTVYGEWYDAARTDLGSVPYVLTAYSNGEVLWVEEGVVDPSGPGGGPVSTPSFTATVTEYIPNDNCPNNRGYGTQC